MSFCLSLRDASGCACVGTFVQYQSPPVAGLSLDVYVELPKNRGRKRGQEMAVIGHDRVGGVECFHSMWRFSVCDIPSVLSCQQPLPPSSHFKAVQVNTVAAEGPTDPYLYFLPVSCGVSFLFPLY